MCKDEENNVFRTLDSIKDVVSTLVIYDTGFTDDTVDMIKNYCDVYNIRLFIKHGKFVDYGTSRNVLLKFCEEIESIDYILLMDMNDELKNPEEFIKTQLIDTAYYLPMEWLEVNGNVLNYTSIRLIKNRSGWRYKRKIHEYLVNEDPRFTASSLDGNFKLYQDRKHDNEKTSKRYESDIKLLLESYDEYKSDPENGDTGNFCRDLNYLGVTYLCIANIYRNDKYEYQRLLNKSFQYFKERTIQNSDFHEETFNANLHCGIILEELECHWDACSMFFFKAMELCPNRIEPMLNIANHYIKEKLFSLAFMFLNHACKLEIPKVNLSLLKYLWDYTRFKYYSVVLLHLGQTDENMFKAGKESIEYAMKQRKKYFEDDCATDLELLKLYNELEETFPKVLSTNMVLTTIE